MKTRPLGCSRLRFAQDIRPPRTSSMGSFHSSSLAADATSEGSENSPVSSGSSPSVEHHTSNAGGGTSAMAMPSSYVSFQLTLYRTPLAALRVENIAGILGTESKLSATPLAT